MSKDRTAIIAAKVLEERAWMHARWMERMTFRQISALAAQPRDMGGLGITVSPAGCKSMVATYREDSGDVTMGREERRERQSDEVDMRARAARADLDDAYRAMAAAKTLYVHAVEQEDLIGMGTAAKAVEAAQNVINLADRRLAAAQKDERDLHGLTAAAELKVDVVHRDAIIEELNEELAKLGEEVGA